MYQATSSVPLRAGGKRASEITSSELKRQRRGCFCHFSLINPNM
jgi:hypothetical protein